MKSLAFAVIVLYNNSVLNWKISTLKGNIYVSDYMFLFILYISGPLGVRREESYLQTGIRITFCFLIVLMLLSAVSASSVTGDDAELNAGEKVQIPIVITQNDGIMGFRITVEYPEDILLQPSVKSGSLTESGLLDSNLTCEGHLEIVWCGVADAQGDGSLFVLEFTVAEGTEGKNGKLYFSYSQADTFNELWEDVQLEFSPVTVTITSEEGTSQDIPSTTAPVTVIVPTSQSQDETESTDAYIMETETSFQAQSIPTTDTTIIGGEELHENDAPVLGQPQPEDTLPTEDREEDASRGSAQSHTLSKGLSLFRIMLICVISMGVSAGAVLILRKRRK